MNTDNKLEHAHHFTSRDHEYESSKQGVWLFMVTEVLMFGGLLVAYFIFHALYPDTFVEGSKYLDWRLGAVNTVVLLFSSLTMALGIYYIRINERAKAINALIITLVCGAIFMAIKYYEYTHKFHLGLFPGSYFNPQGLEVQSSNLALYFSFYFMLTGLHGTHVLVGMGLITWMIIRLKNGWYSDKHWTGVEGVGIFWHLVDLVWIYLFPLLYLVG